MAYVTLGQLKGYLGISEADDDGLLQQILDGAQKAIDKFCDRTFEAAADTTRYVDYDKRHVVDRTLYLDYDLAWVTSVVNGDGETIAASAYVTIPRHETPYYALKLKTGSAKAWTFQDDPEDAIAITGRWAYSLTVPDDVELACMRLAAWLYRQKDTSKGDTDRPILGGFGVVILPSQLPKDVVQLLQKYVREA
ncbi:MAG: phage gp6-like head-tail connector protein [Chloroflexi bacterium]|nr:phage gp6-like head-tail connector protein [Chloroflexota bacterium]